MSFGVHLFGAWQFGRDGDVAKAPDRAFGGAVYGAQFYGFAESLEASVTGAAIGIDGTVVGNVGQFAILSGDIGIEGAAVGAIVLNGLVSGGIGIEGTSSGDIYHDGTSSGEIGIEGTAVGYIRLDGDITGDAIGVSGQVFGFAGAVASYDKVAARLVSNQVRGRVVTDQTRGRFVNSKVKGRF